MASLSSTLALGKETLPSLDRDRMAAVHPTGEDASPPPSSHPISSHKAAPYKTALSLNIIGATCACRDLFQRLQEPLSLRMEACGLGFTAKSLTINGDPCLVRIYAPVGQERFRHLDVKFYYDWNISGLFFAIDLADSESLASARARLAEVTAKRSPATFACALIGTLAEGKERVVAEAEGAALAAQYGAPYAEAVGSSSLEEAVSALAASALDKLPLIAAAREQEKQQSQRAQGGCGCAIV